MATSESNGSAPDVELSIVLVAESLAGAGETLAALGRQGDTGRFELVLALLGGARPDSAELAAFPRRRVVTVDHPLDVGRAEAAAVRVAAGRWIVFAECCAFPEPGFVDALLAGCRGGRGDVIGPALTSANPASAPSWAAQTINYLPWSVAASPGLAALLPGHNSAYRGAALAAMGDRLDAVIGSLTAVQVELRARGGSLWIEPAARVAILNVSHAGWFVVDQFGKGRHYASFRARDWPWARRWLFAAGSALLPLVRGARIAAALRRRGRWREAVDAGRLIALCAGLIASAAGEARGYVAPGEMPASFYARNLRRRRYLRRGERGAAN